MHTKLLSWLLVLGLAAIFTRETFAQAPAVPAASTQVAGRIVATRIRGEVTATDKQTNVARRLEGETEISQGTVVSTGRDSSVVLVFNNGATLNLGTETVLDIQTFTQDPFGSSTSVAEMTEEPSPSTTRVRLNRGELVGKVAKLKREQGSTFTVDTPVGAAGIRGTTFRIVFRPDGTGRAFFSMTTLEGDVEVVLATGTISVPDNKEVVIAEVTIEVSTTGEITVTNQPSAAPLVVDAPTSTIQEVTAAAQVIAEAVAEAVVVPPTPTPPATPPETPATEKANAEAARDKAATKKEDPLPAPPVQTPPPLTTPQDGQ